MSSDPREPGYSFEATNAPGKSPDEIAKELDTSFEAKNADAQQQESQMPDPIMAKLNKIADSLQSLDARMTKIEERNVRADSSHQERVEIARDDLARRQRAATLAEIKALETKRMLLENQQKPRTASEDRACADIQARADAVYQHVGRRAPAPNSFQTPLEYRRQLCTGLSRYASDPNFAKISFDACPKDIFEKFEGQVYADVLNNPVAILKDARPGEIIPREEVDKYTGRRVITFHGRNNFIMGMKPNLQVLRPNKHGNFFGNHMDW